MQNNNLCDQQSIEATVFLFVICSVTSDDDLGS